MGYYTNYEVSWDNTKTTIAQQKLIVKNFNKVLENEDNFYPHLVTVEDNFFAIKAKWYDMEIDMMDISKQIPNIKFEVSAFDEVGEWEKFLFKNGKMLYDKGNVQYQDLKFEDDE